MSGIELRPNENIKYEVIRYLVLKDGNKKKAALKLNCTVRNIDRLIKVYKEKGKAGFIHGNRGRKPAKMIPVEMKDKIVTLYLNQYKDTNFYHFSEIVKEDMNIKVSPHTLNGWLYREGYLSPKAHRRTKKRLKKELAQKLDEAKGKKVKNELKEKVDLLDECSAHPRRSRSKYMGEMIQMDASSYHWVSDDVWHLHLGVDDASGKIVGARFEKQETLNGYYHVFFQTLTKYGIPAMFYTDGRTVFIYKSKHMSKDEEDTYTQFAYACKQLGVDIKVTHVPQAKGRVERLNQTLQARLPIELRRHNIHTIEEANVFLAKYIEQFNQQFSLDLNESQSVYEKAPSKDEIMKILSVLTERTIDNGHSIRFKNKFYIPVDQDGNEKYLPAKTKCLVIESFDHKKYLTVNNVIFSLKEIPERKRVSENFDTPLKDVPKKVYIPPMNHPWRHTSFVNFRNQQVHRA